MIRILFFALILTSTVFPTIAKNTSTTNVVLLISYGVGQPKIAEEFEIMKRVVKHPWIDFDPFILEDDLATRENILKASEELAQKAGIDGTLMLVFDGWTRGRTNRGLEELKGWDHGIHYESRRIFPNKLADAKPLEGLKVLDVGCGDGKLVKEFRAKKVEAYGIDLYLNKEQRQHPELFQQGLAENLPYKDNSFDILYYNASAFLHGTVSREGYVAYLKEASRVLKPGGKIRISFVDGDLLAAAIKELLQLSVSEMPTKIGRRTFEWDGKPWSTAGTGNGEWIFAELIKK